MKRKIGVVLMSAMVVANVGLASPLLDYSQGQVSLDISVAPNNDIKVTSKVAGEPNLSLKFDGKSRNLDYNLMAGLGGIGIQYRSFSPDSEITYNADLDSNATYEAEFKEFNVLRKIDAHSACFIGYVTAEGRFTPESIDPDINLELDSATKKTWQVGYIHKKALNKKLDAYSIIAFGNDVRSSETGLVHKFNKNAEFNISYREKKVKDVKFTDDTVGDFYNDITVKGINYGLTWKF